MEYIEKRYPAPNENGVIGLVFEPKEPQEAEPETEPETVNEKAESPESKAPAKQKKKA